MSELVKYHNYMNALEFRKFTSTDYDFLMYLCSQMRDIETEEVVFSLSEIREVTKIRNVSNEEFITAIKGMNAKLLQITADVKDGDEDVQFALFPTFRTNRETNTLTVAVNQRFRFILNELSKNFTQFELETFTELNSKYSKTLFRLLKQYRSTGEYHVKLEELKKLLGCPESYDSRKIMQKIITPAVTELQKEFPCLKCEAVKARKRGAPVTGYHFTFEADGQIPGQSTFDEALSEMTKYKARKQTEPKKSAPKKSPKKNQFNNYEQRDYDYTALEKQLLQQQVEQK